MLRSSPRYVLVASLSSLAGVKIVKDGASRKGTGSTTCDCPHSGTGPTLSLSSACLEKEVRSNWKWGLFLQEDTQGGPLKHKPISLDKAS